MRYEKSTCSSLFQHTFSTLFYKFISCLKQLQPNALVFYLLGGQFSTDVFLCHSSLSNFWVVSASFLSTWNSWFLLFRWNPPFRGVFPLENGSWNKVKSMIEWGSCWMQCRNRRPKKLKGNLLYWYVVNT